MNRLEEIAAGLEQPAPEGPAARLNWYIQELLHWNRGLNLVSRRLTPAGARGLVRDSLAVVDCLPAEPGRCLDIGAGGGLPGIVVALIRPEWEVTLLERRRKRAVFLEHLRDRMDLPHVRVVSADARELTQQAEHREGYRVVLLRAVADPAGSFLLGRPFLQQEGRIILMTGDPPTDPPGTWLPASERIPGARGWIGILRVGECFP